MKTIAIPDNLFEQAELEARLRGVSVNDLAEQALKEVLALHDDSEQRHEVEFPIIRSTSGHVITDEKVKAAIAADEESEAMYHARFMRR